MPPVNADVPQPQSIQTVQGRLGFQGVYPLCEKKPGMMTIARAMATPLHLGSFNVTAANAAGDKLWTIMLPAARTGASGIDQNGHLHWQDLALMSGKYWRGNVVIRMYCESPARLVGKLIVRYRTDSANLTGWTATVDSTYRDSTVEWDLAKSDYIDIQCNMFTAGQWAHTRAPMESLTSVTQPTQREFYFYGNGVPRSNYFMGALQVVVSIPLQIGGVFPDSYTIHAWKMISNGEVAVPCDHHYNPDSSVFTHSQMIATLPAY